MALDFVKNMDIVIFDYENIPPKGMEELQTEASVKALPSSLSPDDWIALISIFFWDLFLCTTEEDGICFSKAFLLLTVASL